MYISSNRDLNEAETDAFLATYNLNPDGSRMSEAERAAPEATPSADPAAPRSADDIAEQGACNEEEARALGWSQELDPVPVRARRDGWTAWRQRLFIEMLAQTGCVSEAARAAGVTPRSAYRLRCRYDAAAFNAAWDQALEVASNRLTALAFERAIHGRVKPVWYKGEIVGEERVPSDRLLAYLLQHYDRTRYGNLSGILPFAVPDPRKSAQEALPEMLRDLEDHRLPAEAPRRAAFTAPGDPVDPRGAV